MPSVIRVLFVIALFGSPFVAAGRTFPAPQDVSVAKLIPLARWQKQFKITEGADRGRVVPLTFRHDPQKVDRWTLAFGDYAAVSLLRNSDGALAMERLDLVKSRSYIVYEPALPILPRDFAGQSFDKRQAFFKMYDVETGVLKRTGRASHVVKQFAASRFDTPAGAIDGYYVTIDHRMEMQFAHLNMTIGLGCRLDDGPVYGSGRYTLTKLGFLSSTKTVSAALASF
jgi:hypothetical protein